MWDNNVPWVWEAPTPTKEETLTLPTTHCSDPMYKPMYSCKYKYTNRQFFKRFYQRNCPPPIALIPPTIFTVQIQTYQHLHTKIAPFEVFFLLQRIYFPGQTINFCLQHVTHILVWRLIWYIWGPSTWVLWSVRFFVTLWDCENQLTLFAETLSYIQIDKFLNRFTTYKTLMHLPI